MVRTQPMSIKAKIWKRGIFSPSIDETEIYTVKIMSMRNHFVHWRLENGRFCLIPIVFSSSAVILYTDILHCTKPWYTSNIPEDAFCTCFSWYCLRLWWQPLSGRGGWIPQPHCQRWRCCQPWRQPHRLSLLQQEGKRKHNSPMRTIEFLNFTIEENGD